MAMRDVFNTIVVSENPRGRFQNGYITGTPKPGTVMQISAGVEPVGGRFTWVVYNRDADSNRPLGPLAVLCEDDLQGKEVDTAYVTGTLGKLYFPLPGDELLMLLADVAGTDTDTHTIGEILIVDDGTGLLLTTTGSPEIEPFTCLETLAGFAANGLVHCMFSGF